MAIARCPHCGKEGRVPADTLGVTVRCPECRTRFTPSVAPPLPDLAPAPVAEPDPAVVASFAAISAPPPSPPSMPLPPARTPASVPPPDPPREPWYYGFLAVYAIFCIGLGCLQFVLILVALVATGDAAHGQPSPVSALILVYSFVGLLGSLLLAAPVLLFVDAARNLRAMRFGVAR